MKIGFAAPLTVTDLLPWLDLEPGVTPPIGLGGPNTTDLLRGLLRGGHRVAAVTLDPRIEAPVTLRGDRLTLHVGAFRPRHRGRDYFRHERAVVRSAMLAERPDVIGAHWAYEFALGSLETKLPTVVSLHDWAPTILRLMGWRVAPYYTLRLAMQTQTLLRAAAFTANSPTTAERAARWTRGPVPVVPNAVDDQLFETPHRPLDGGAPLIVAVNNGFNRCKNTATLLEAFPEVRSEIPDARLHLIGEDHGPGGRAEQWARQRGLCDSVTFLGPMPRADVLARLADADLFVHPSREESFGSVLVEAMAQGTPAVGGRESGAVPWVLDGGRAGVLADVEHAEVLGQDLLGLLRDPVRWDRLSTSGRRISKQRFCLSEVAPTYADILGHFLTRGALVA